MKKIIQATFVILFCCSASYAQHLSQAMQFANPVEASDSNSISIRYSNLFYLRDYEYTHQIQTGYTLFGTWHYPRVSIQPNSWLKIEAGALLQKEYGDKQLDRAWPVFSLQIRQKNFRILLGALEGNQSHGLVEPHMSFDKVIERPIEEGVQLKYNSKRIKADIWLDWELRQKENADYPEELTGGLTFSYLLSQPEKPWRFSIPLQVIVPHKGGQLDTNSSAVITVLNPSAGVAAEWNNSAREKWLQYAKFDMHFMDYKLFHNDNAYAYNKGSGFLANAYLRSKWNFSFLASYWKGENFVAPKGGKLYQSISSIPGRDHKEPERQLLFLNFIYEKELFPGFFADCRFSPYVDLGNSFLENSFLVLLSYRGNFRIGKLKK